MGKRGNKEGSIYQRSDGRWAAAISLGYFDGKLKRKTIYAATREEVARKLSLLLVNLRNGEEPTNDRYTVGELLRRWLEDSVRVQCKPRTFESYSQQVRLHLVPAFDKVPLTRLSPQQVQRFINDKIRSGLSPRTVQYLRAILRKALGQALKWGLVNRNVATLVDPPRVVRKRIHPLSADQVKALFAATATNRLKALYVLAITTGMREGELLALRWSNADLHAGVIHVRETIQRIGGKLVVGEPKSQRGHRKLSLSTIAIEALRHHRVLQLQERMAAGVRWQEADLVFTTRLGTPIEARNLIRSFKRALADSGLPDMRFHDLRHSCASLLLAEGTPPRVIMEVLGHSEIRVTMDTYAHVMPEMLNEAASKMDVLLGR